VVDEKEERRKQFMIIVNCDKNVANTFLSAYSECIETSVAAYFATPKNEILNKTKEVEHETKEEERRIDATDGGLYTKQEFMDFYAGLVEWNEAERVSSIEEYDRTVALTMQLASENGRRGEEEEEEEEDMISQWHGVSNRVSVGVPRTKHDSVVCGMNNSELLSEQFGMQGVGDLVSSKVITPNRVFNSLRSHYAKSRKKGMSTTGGVSRETYRTTNKVLDDRTQKILFRWINKSFLAEVYGSIRTGKEANVLHASGFPKRCCAKEKSKDDSDEKASDVAVKIFKTTLNEFSNRREYVDGDQRFSKTNISKNTRKLCKVWCEKEWKNLSRLYRCPNIRSPRPLLFEDNCIVMEFIGKSGRAASQLREAVSRRGIKAAKRLDRCYIEVVLMMRAMYAACSLVHADLSEYNILYHSGHCYIIDVGQAVTKSHPKVHEFLRRDIKTISNFFRKLRAPRVLENDVLFDFIVGDDDDDDKSDDVPGGKYDAKRLESLFEKWA